MAQERKQSLEDAAAQLYSNLLASLPSSIDIIIPILQDGPCIWTGAGFLDAGAVAMQSPEDLRPYLYGVPQAVLPFRDLLVMLKVGLHGGICPPYSLLSLKVFCQHAL